MFEDIIDDWFRDKVIGNDLNTILKDLVTLNIEEFEAKFEILAPNGTKYTSTNDYSIVIKLTYGENKPSKRRSSQKRNGRSEIA